MCSQKAHRRVKVKSPRFNYIMQQAVRHHLSSKSVKVIPALARVDKRISPFSIVTSSSRGNGSSWILRWPTQVKVFRDVFITNPPENIGETIPITNDRNN